ncbi:hypothetical protein EV363DRAFT_1433920 [Boletus edulis]|nr:hypothetical protein EV363DRAFT_1433920 [Boletus edulis]
MLIAQHPHKGVELNVAVSASLAFATMIVEFLWYLRDEVKYIWPRLRTSWNPRIYMFTRYVGIASQIYNLYFAIRMYLGIDNSPAGCRTWFTYQVIVVQLLLLTAEGLLIHRLYALFLRSRPILDYIASMGVSARISNPSNVHTVTCLVVTSNPGNAFFSATTMTTNLVICFMTFSRYFRLPSKWTRQGLGRTVFRDSALSLGAISIMMLFLMLCSLNVIKPTMSGNITYYWLVCVLWISIGRIIVNHEKLPRDEGEQGEGNTWRGTLQITSQIEMGESTLSLDTQSGSSARTPTSKTLESSLSMPMIKTGQLPSSTASPSDSSRKCLSDRSSFRGLGDRCSLQPPNSRSSSIRRLSRPNICAGDSGTPPSGDHLPADEGSSTETSSRRHSHSDICTNDSDIPQSRGHPPADAGSSTEMSVHRDLHSNACMSGGDIPRSGDHPPADAGSSTEASIRPLSHSNVCTSDGETPQGDHPSPEPPSLEVSS